jgi:hypothetical protein
VAGTAAVLNHGLLHATQHLQDSQTAAHEPCEINATDATPSICLWLQHKSALQKRMPCLLLQLAYTVHS